MSAMDGVTRIPLPTPFRVGTVNAYLVEGDPLALVDTGPDWPPALQALEAALARLGYRIEDIELIALTHHHVDHVGLTRTLTRRSGAEVAAVGAVARHVATYEESVAAEDAYQGAVMRQYGIDEERIRKSAEISRRYWQYGRSVVVDRLLAMGDTIRLGSRDFDVALRPGHSPADTVFGLEDRSAAFVGDHVLARISSNALIHRPLSGSHDPQDRDLPLLAYLDSLRRTSDDGYAILLGGHGAVVGEPAERIARQLGGHRLRKAKILGLIRAGARRVDEIIDALWPHLDSSETFLAVSEVLGHTDLLVVDGAVGEAAGRGGTTFRPASP